MSYKTLLNWASSVLGGGHDSADVAKDAASAIGGHGSGSRVHVSCKGAHLRSSGGAAFRNGDNGMGNICCRGVGHGEKYFGITSLC